MELLITGALKKDDELFSSLEKMGHHITYLQDEKSLVENPSIFEGIICNALFLYNPIELFTSLKYIQLTSQGFDRVPLDYIKTHNIEIHNAKDVYSIPMAEYALCGVLQLYKQTKFFYNNQQKHEWIKNRQLEELNNKTVTILGCGSVGIQCAKRFKAFDTKVLGIDIIPKQNEYFDHIYPLDQLDYYLSNTDVLVVSLPLSEETYHILNKERLSKLSNKTIVVNVARGKLIDEEALIQVIPTIKGAVLDVFEDEPLDSNSPLWDMSNVILTPHNSFVSVDNKDRLNEVIISNLK